MQLIKRSLLGLFEILGYSSLIFRRSNVKPRHVIHAANKHVWFGYYDHIPSCGSNVLFHQADDLESASSADICIYAMQTGSTKLLSHSTAFSSQLGSRLSWRSANLIHFNSYNSANPATLICDYRSSYKLFLPFHFWNYASISDSETIYGSLNMTRLAQYRQGYGYNYFGKHLQCHTIDLNFLRVYKHNIHQQHHLSLLLH